MSVVPGVRYLTTRNAVADFFEMASAGSLQFPAVVVSRPSHSPGPLISLAELYADVGDVADVYYLDGSVHPRDVVKGQAAAKLNEVNVYGGAIRVIPAGQWGSASLFLARTPEEGRAKVGAIRNHLKRLTAVRGSVAYATQSTDATDEVHRAPDSVRVVELTAENAELKKAVRALRATSAAGPTKPKAPKTGPVPTQKQVRRMFADAKDEIRFRVMALWAEQTTPQQKLDQPLPSYAVSEGFAESLDMLSEHNPALLDKTAKAVLRILLGQDRGGHKLDASGKVREDGAVSWRSYIEQGTPSARRLHYWRKPGGSIQLAKVVVHDDYSV